MTAAGQDGERLVTEAELRAEWTRWFTETNAVDKAFAVRDDEQRQAFLRAAVAEAADPAHLTVVNRLAADAERRVLDRVREELRVVLTDLTLGSERVVEAMHELYQRLSDDEDQRKPPRTAEQAEHLDGIRRVRDAHWQ